MDASQVKGVSSPTHHSGSTSPVLSPRLGASGTALRRVSSTRLFSFSPPPCVVCSDRLREVVTMKVNKGDDTELTGILITSTHTYNVYNVPCNKNK